MVVEDIGRQISSGNKSIVGIMLESHLFSGNQSISKNMQYGVSVTDGCIDWNETNSILRKLSEQVRP
jgi:3-deoxy-7-phosphoheptulonate synthase